MHESEENLGGRERPSDPSILKIPQFQRRHVTLLVPTILTNPQTQNFARPRPQCRSPLPRAQLRWVGTDCVCRTFLRLGAIPKTPFKARFEGNEAVDRSYTCPVYSVSILAWTRILYYNSEHLRPSTCSSCLLSQANLDLPSTYMYR